jgi:type IV pilus assembly protein PilB
MNEADSVIINRDLGAPSGAANHAEAPSYEGDASQAAELEARLEEIAAIVRRARVAVDATTSESRPEVLGTAPRLGEMLVERDLITPQQLDETLELQRATGRGTGTVPRLGQMMVERDLITPQQLDAALDLQRTTGRRIGETLVEMDVVSSIEVALVLAEHLGVPFVDLRTQPPDPALADLVPADLAVRYSALPVARWDDQLVVAMANPNDVFAIDDLRVVIGQPILAALTDPEQLQIAIRRTYQGVDVATSLDSATSDIAEAELASIAVVDNATDGPMVQLISALIEQAARDHASDLHVEPSSTKVGIRFRIDGVLHDVSEAPLPMLRPMVSRLKLLGGLDIAQSRLPQDGRFSTKVQGRAIDVRIATAPTAAGETVVLRLLDATRGAIDVKSLGLSTHEHARLIPAFHSPQGAVIVTGPTGSGKTSTLYAVLSQISTRDKSIVSVEDPVEYRLDGIKQMQINTRAGMTFPTALRSILRIDPDVIFVGEIRDGETAKIASDAAITGHLVVSTLHTTRAAASPIRLIDMGVEPYLVASALTCVAAQRLVRRLCEVCAQPTQQSAEELLSELGAPDSIVNGATIRGPVGCPDCLKTGYKGRMAIYEIMPISEGIERLIVERAPAADLERLAVAEGMDTMRTAAFRRVAAGELSLEEMGRSIA